MSACAPTADVSLQRGEPPLRAWARSGLMWRSRTLLSLAPPNHLRGFGMTRRRAPRTNAFAICVNSFIVIPLRFAGVLRPIVGGFDVPPWSAIKRFWPLVWSHKR